MQRVQLGSASGMRAQESWHRHKLMAYLGRHSSISTFADNLAKFAQSLLLNSRVENAEPFPNKMVLIDSDWLTSQERTSTQQLHRTKCYNVCADATTSLRDAEYFLSKRDQEQKAWTGVSDSPGSVDNLKTLGSRSVRLAERARLPYIGTRQETPKVRVHFHVLPWADKCL